MSVPPKRSRNAAHTRDHILAAARHQFAREGFAGAKVHAIAAAAGVSPNLITRYFGGKDGLFVAATEVRLKLDALLDGPRRSLGQRLARGIVTRWTTIEGDDPLLMLLRASGEHAQAGAALSAFLDEESLAPLRRRLLDYGMRKAQAEGCARAIDVFVLGITARLRMLRDDLGDTATLEIWIATTIQALVDAGSTVDDASGVSPAPEVAKQVQKVWSRD